jgi:hypothetical protein
VIHNGTTTPGNIFRSLVEGGAGGTENPQTTSGVLGTTKTSYPRGKTKRN